MQLAMDTADRLRVVLQKLPADAITVVGPARCPVERIKNRWRWHLMLKSGHPGQLTRVAHWVARKAPVPSRGELRIVVDRDPVSLL